MVSEIFDISPGEAVAELWQIEDEEKKMEDERLRQEEEEERQAEERRVLVTFP